MDCIKHGATMNPCKCGWYGDPGCRPKYKADLFPHTPGCDMFPCTADIQAIISWHVETVALLGRKQVGDYLHIAVNTEDLETDVGRIYTNDVIKQYAD